MQRVGQAARNGAGVIRSYGDDISHFQTQSNITISIATVLFSCPFTKPGRYVFDGLYQIFNSLTESVTVGYGVTFPGGGVLMFNYSMPTGAFAAAGGAVGWGFSGTSGSTPAVTAAMSAAGGTGTDCRPVRVYGGLRILDGTPPGTIDFIATKTVGGGNLQLNAYSRIECQNMEP